MLNYHIPLTLHVVQKLYEHEQCVIDHDGNSCLVNQVAQAMFHRDIGRDCRGVNLAFRVEAEVENATYHQSKVHDPRASDYCVAVK